MNDQPRNGTIGKNTSISIAIVVSLMGAMLFLGMKLAKIDENTANIMKVEGDIRQIKSDIREIRDLVIDGRQ